METQCRFIVKNNAVKAQLGVQKHATKLFLRSKVPAIKSLWNLGARALFMSPMLGIGTIENYPAPITDAFVRKVPESNYCDRLTSYSGRVGPEYQKHGPNSKQLIAWPSKLGKLVGSARAILSYFYLANLKFVP